jgi:hypothetical protein
MSERLPRLTARQIIGILEQNGFALVRSKSANAAKNRDWERGVFPRACTCFLRPPGSFNRPFVTISSNS